MTDIAWRSRITGYGTAAPDVLMINPANWRVHPRQQQAALTALMDRVGWVRHVIVNEATGHIVDGHLRVQLALARGESELPVVYVTLSEAEERVILAALDPIAGLAATDTAALMALAASIQVDSPDVDEIGTLVQAMAGTSRPSAAPVPTQEQIDERTVELDHAFEQRHLQTYDADCPGCGHHFAFAR
jgi:ParB-like chromosome segregation protein Spo0J